VTISFLCQDYNKSSRGVETYVKELSAHLISLGHEVKVYKNIFDNVDPNTQILINTNGRLDAILSRLWCWVHKACLIISGQSGIGWDDKLNLWVFPDIFVGLTDYQCRWARSINPFVRIEKIPNGVDLEKFNPNVKPAKINKKPPVILDVGVVDDFKRQYLLKRASRYSILLVGKGGDMECRHEDMPGIYTACDLFSYPTSERESFGIAVLEAMASGLAVVATDDPIRREIVGDAGLFVDPQNTKKYSEKLAQAIKTDWGDRPRKQAEKYSWIGIAKKYDSLCRHNR
jgi:glycosyltransferase involved in cell wall biosynthesis